MALARRLSPVLDADPVVLEGGARSRHLHIPDGDYTTPFWVRLQPSGIVVQVTSLPWRFQGDASSIQVLSQAPIIGVSRDAAVAWRARQHVGRDAIVAWDVAASEGGVQPFFSDSFQGGQRNDANGVEWGTPGPACTVSAANPRTGTHSLQFDTGGEQRFNFGRNLSEVWIEFYIHYPSNFSHPNESPSNNKFFRMWGPNDGGFGHATYNNINKVGASTWFASGGASNFRFDYVRDGNTAIGPGETPAHILVPADGSNLNEWLQIRLHCKHASADGAHDGVLQLWVNGGLVNDFQDVDQEYEATHSWYHGYLLGATNADFAEQTLIYIDDVEFYDQNPGW